VTERPIVFAQTRYSYDSYTDYWKLVGLSGFPTCYVDEVNFSREAVYIVSPLNGEWKPHRDAHRDDNYRARVVWWCLERPGGSYGMAAYRQGCKEALDDWYFDEVWLSDKYLVFHMHDDRVRFVILGSHPGLGTTEKGPREYDFAHMSYQNGRRNHICAQFTKRNIRMAPNGWGDERKKALCESGFMLNVHQDDFPALEPLRFSLAAAFGLPILTEACSDAYPYTRGGDDHCIIEVEYDELIGRAARLLNDDYNWWQAMGRRTHRMMCGEYTFGKMVRQAVGGLPMPSTMEIV